MEELLGALLSQRGEAGDACGAWAGAADLCKELLKAEAAEGVVGERRTQQQEEEDEKEGRSGGDGGAGAQRSAVEVAVLEVLRAAPRETCAHAGGEHADWGEWLHTLEEICVFCERLGCCSEENAAAVVPPGAGSLHEEGRRGGGGGGGGLVEGVQRRVDADNDVRDGKNGHDEEEDSRRSRIHLSVETRALQATQILQKVADVVLQVFDACAARNAAKPAGGDVGMLHQQLRETDNEDDGNCSSTASFNAGVRILTAVLASLRTLHPMLDARVAAAMENVAGTHSGIAGLVLERLTRVVSTNEPARVATVLRLSSESLVEMSVPQLDALRELVVASLEALPSDAATSSDMLRNFVSCVPSLTRSLGAALCGSVPPGATGTRVSSAGSAAIVSGAAIAGDGVGGAAAAPQPGCIDANAAFAMQTHSEGTDARWLSIVLTIIQHATDAGAWCRTHLEDRFRKHLRLRTSMGDSVDVGLVSFERLCTLLQAADGAHAGAAGMILLGMESTSAAARADADAIFFDEVVVTRRWAMPALASAMAATDMTRELTEVVLRWFAISRRKGGNFDARVAAETASLCCASVVYLNHGVHLLTELFARTAETGDDGAHELYRGALENVLHRAAVNRSEHEDFQSAAIGCAVDALDGHRRSAAVLARLVSVCLRGFEGSEESAVRLAQALKQLVSWRLPGLNADASEQSGSTFDGIIAATLALWLRCQATASTVTWRSQFFAEMWATVREYCPFLFARHLGALVHDELVRSNGTQPVALCVDSVELLLEVYESRMTELKAWCLETSMGVRPSASYTFDAAPAVLTASMMLLRHRKFLHSTSSSTSLVPQYEQKPVVIVVSPDDDDEGSHRAGGVRVDRLWNIELLRRSIESTSVSAAFLKGAVDATTPGQLASLLIVLGSYASLERGRREICRECMRAVSNVMARSTRDAIAFDPWTAERVLDDCVSGLLEVMHEEAGAAGLAGGDTTMASDRRRFTRSSNLDDEDEDDNDAAYSGALGVARVLALLAGACSSSFAVPHVTMVPYPLSLDGSQPPVSALVNTTNELACVTYDSVVAGHSSSAATSERSSVSVAVTIYVLHAAVHAMHVGEGRMRDTSWVSLLLSDTVRGVLGMDALKFVERGCGHNSIYTCGREVASRPASAVVIFVFMLLVRGGQNCWEYVRSGTRPRSRGVLGDVLDTLTPLVLSECFDDGHEGRTEVASGNDCVDGRGAERALTADVGNRNTSGITVSGVPGIQQHVASVLRELASILASEAPYGADAASLLIFEMQIARGMGEASSHQCPIVAMDSVLSLALSSPVSSEMHGHSGVLGDVLVYAARTGCLGFLDVALGELEGRLADAADEGDFSGVYILPSCLRASIEAALLPGVGGAVGTEAFPRIEEEQEEDDDERVSANAMRRSIFIRACRMYGVAMQHARLGSGLLRVLHVLETYADAQGDAAGLRSAYDALLERCGASTPDVQAIHGTRDPHHEEERRKMRRKLEKKEDEDEDYGIVGAGGVDGNRGWANARKKNAKKTKKKKKKRRNPFIVAAMQQKKREYDEDEDDYSDLEDWLVCKPGRDYSRFFKRHEEKRMRNTSARTTNATSGAP